MRFSVMCLQLCANQANSPKKTQGVRIDAVRGVVHLLCTQLGHMRHHCAKGGWEHGLALYPVSSPIRRSWIHCINLLIQDLQTHFAEGEWVDTEGLESWVEASSCSCEWVFSFVTASDCGQSMLQMCEMLWVRCNGVAVEDWCPANV